MPRLSVEQNKNRPRVGDMSPHYHLCAQSRSKLANLHSSHVIIFPAQSNRDGERPRYFALAVIIRIAQEEIKKKTPTNNDLLVQCTSVPAAENVCVCAVCIRLPNTEINSDILECFQNDKNTLSGIILY